MAFHLEFSEYDLQQAYPRPYVLQMTLAVSSFVEWIHSPPNGRVFLDFNIQNLFENDPAKPFAHGLKNFNLILLLWELWNHRRYISVKSIAHIRFRSFFATLLRSFVQASKKAKEKEKEKESSGGNGKRSQRTTSNVFAMFKQNQIQEFKEVSSRAYIRFRFPFLGEQKGQGGWWWEEGPACHVERLCHVQTKPDSRVQRGQSVCQSSLTPPTGRPHLLDTTPINPPTHTMYLLTRV